MVNKLFIVVLGFIIGAVAIENKDDFTHQIPVPVATLPDGAKYEGDLVRGTFHGKGKLVWPDGHFYEGDFEFGQFHGEGVLKTAVFRYEGQFTSGGATGEGEISYSNGDKYLGQVLEAVPHGHGVLTQRDGTEYKGEFVYGDYHGYGELSDTSGFLYSGHFDKGVFHGEGVYIDLSSVSQSAKGNKADKETDQRKQGMRYSGHFDQGEFTGEGVWTYQSAAYEGEFKNWKFNGKGLYSDEKGSYQGTFVSGRLNGKGTFTSSTGLEYSGEFVQGIYHGKGVLINEKGDRYEGTFEFGQKHGKGVLEFAEALDDIEQVKGTWRYDVLVDGDQSQLVVKPGELVEHAIYQQTGVLEAALADIQAQREDKIDLYFVGVAGDGKQGVFRREMQTVQQLFDEKYDTKGRSISLINSPVTHENTPLATVTSLENTLQTVGKIMDAENDILFLFLTSHGSRDFQLELDQPGLSLKNLAAKDLDKMLDDLPIRYKVVVISACFSGGFIPVIKDSSTMVITAASPDKASFGCEDRGRMTYFSEAFFKDALHQSDNFSEAFSKARDIVRGREAKEGFEYSEPQFFKNRDVSSQLRLWRQQFLEK